MLRIITNTSATGAKGYYTTADYYTEGQELVGHWRGLAAARLGLSGEVKQPEWDALCDNIHPATGGPLTLRRNEQRRVGYDFNFHAPKSVSLLYALTQDDRLLDVFRGAVDETMKAMEAEMQTRVRVDGGNEDRITGNMVWGEFVHLTARPVDGVPDPHLHAHCFVFNATYDKEETRWKAGQFAGIKQDAPYFEAVFHSLLARRLEALGLPTVRTRTGWELEGLTPEVLKRFSRRTTQIEDKARALGLDDDKAKDGLGAKTREKKSKSLGMDELREEWRGRLSAEESQSVDELARRIGGEPVAEDDKAGGSAAARAVEHGFERSAVIPERKLLADALKRGVGKASAERVLAAVAKHDLIWADRDGRRLVTTREVLEEEQRMLGFARSGRGTCRTLGTKDHVFARDFLNEDQRKAVLHVLTSPDRIILIRGAAGTGKTTMMKEAVEAIEKGGQSVVTLAPSANASRGVLQGEGFADADTVARFLVDEKFQAKAKGQVVWVDEAGLLGTKMMNRLFDTAGRLDARVILSGDKRQHGSVERGAALRLLESEAGLVPAEIREIQRQKGDYKQAVRALSEGRTDQGFRELDRLGWIKEVRREERAATLAADYVNTIKSGKTALVVSPTHAEGDRITSAIRSALTRKGALKKDEREFLALTNLNLTASDRADAERYESGDVIVFHQNAPGHSRGERVVVGSRGEGVQAKGGASAAAIPLTHADRFQVFKPGTLKIAPGELLRVTRNGFTKDSKHRLNNGAVYRVKGFTKSKEGKGEGGDIVLDNGWIVAADYGHLAHGYVTTSHSSQGKTVDHVLIGQSSESFPASSGEQFYVSASRARHRATVYCDDKAALMEAVSREEERPTATEFVQMQTPRTRTPQQTRQRAAVLHRDTARERPITPQAWKAASLGERSRGPTVGGGRSRDHHQEMTLDG